MLPTRAQLVFASDRITAPLDLVSSRVAGAYLETTRRYPKYYHGNRLVLDRPPHPDEVERWIARYHAYFAWRVAEAPTVITWYEDVDETQSLGSMDPFLQTQTALFASECVSTVAPVSDVTFSEVSDASGWEDLAALELATHPEYGAFNRWRVESFRELVEAGRGAHYALRSPAGEMVAAAGGYARDGLARFANVVTAEAFRKRGYARYLIATILQTLRARAASVIIVADRGSAAERVYRAVGFEPRLSVHSLVIPPT